MGDRPRPFRVGWGTLLPCPARSFPRNSWPADCPDTRSARTVPSLVSLDSSMVSPGAGTRGGVAYSSSSPAYSSRCSDAMAAADIVRQCGLPRAEGEGWMLHSENGSPNPLCYHQNLILFDLTMACTKFALSVSTSWPYARARASLAGARARYRPGIPPQT